MLPEHGHLNRNYYLGKYLKRLGHEPVVFVGSHPHNTNLQLIEGSEPYRVYQEEPFPWVLIKTRNYEGSKKSRVLSMFEFYNNMKKAAKYFDKPDAIIGSSAHPLAAQLAIQLGKKYGCKSIMEVRDIWPSSIVSYGLASNRNPIIKLLYAYEKKLYLKSDRIIFLFENAYLYFTERGLNKRIPENKIAYVNNGVDLEEFNCNKNTYPYSDIDLDKDYLFKIVYTGSIRKVNNLGLLINIAKSINDPRIIFLIFGDGNERESLEKRVKEEKINNVIFKGRVDKKYIPAITSKADVNILHNAPSNEFKYGISMNKLFDYAAAGKPIICDFQSAKSQIVNYCAGVEISSSDPKDIARTIESFLHMDSVQYQNYCANALRLAHDYSYESLAKKMVRIIEDTSKKEK